MANPQSDAPPHRGNVYDPECSARDVLELVGSKWVLLILPLLQAGPLRNARLLESLSGISQKMLTQTLRELERHGLIHREVFPGKRVRVEYTLTELGCSLSQVLAPLDRWAEANFVQIDLAKARYDAKIGSLNPAP